MRIPNPDLAVDDSNKQRWNRPAHRRHGFHNAHHLFGEAEALLKRVTNAGWYENVGGEGKAVFRWRGELMKREIAISSEHSPTPEVIDLDRDGRLDLLLGGENGQIECYHRAFIENDLPSVKVLRIEQRGG